MATQTAKSKLPDVQAPQQIHSLVKAKQTISEIARLLGRNRSTISRELSRACGQHGYRAEQACTKASERAQRSRNARRLAPKVLSDMAFCLELQWSPEQVSQAIEDALKPVNSQVKTLTVDNGKEFAYHQKVDAVLSIQTYFADPYCSWQRGSNENFNGLLRQYIPKKRPMETVTDEELAMIQSRLNHRPRKRLGFKTPYEVFHASLNRVAVRT